MKKVLNLVTENLPVLVMSTIGCVIAIKGIEMYNVKFAKTLSVKPSTGTIAPATPTVEG